MEDFYMKDNQTDMEAVQAAAGYIMDACAKHKQATEALQKALSKAQQGNDPQVLNLLGAFAKGLQTSSKNLKKLLEDVSEVIDRKTYEIKQIQEMEF